MLTYFKETETYNKPKTYKDQATVETVNQGQPYYVASKEYGYEGKHQPIAGSVFTDHIGTWVICTEARYKPIKAESIKCSLEDDGVMHQTYSPRMTFLTEESARYYAETGKVKD